MVSLAGALAEDLLAGLSQEDGVPRSVLLWLDPDGQFTRLRAAIAGELAGRGATFLALDQGGSQLDVKLALLDIEAEGGRAVVYLQRRALADLDPPSDGRPPALWAFVEYRYKGAVWGLRSSSASGPPPPLDSWLAGRGVRFSGGGARASVTSGGADSRLARYAAHHAILDIGQFPQPVNQQTLNPVGDPRDLVIDLLLDPGGAVTRWGDDGDDARQLIETTYGLRLSGEGPVVWADDLAMHLALVEAWDALGRAADFPFAKRLPASDAARAATLSLMRKAILPRSDVVARVRALVSSHGPELTGLVAWSAGRRGIPAAVPQIVERRLTDLLTAIEAAGSVEEALGLLEERLGNEGSLSDARLEVLGRVAALGRRAAAERIAMVALPQPTALADHFARGAWAVDATYLEIMAACRDQALLAPVRRLAGRIYLSYLDAVNQRFTDLVEMAASWPPEELRSIREEVDELWRRPGKTKDRRAVIIVDALRLDVARQLEARIGQTAELRWVASTLPTTTPFGMTALLPTEHGEVGVVAGTSTVQLFDEDNDSLEERDGRKALLRRLLEGRGDTVAFVEVESLLQGEPVPTARYIVAFTYSLDDRGHSRADTASLPEEASKLPARLARVIERLHAAGVSRVDVVTDHGFLWLNPEDIDALGSPSVPPAQVRKKAPRYAILADGAAGLE